MSAPDRLPEFWTALTAEYARRFPRSQERAARLPAHLLDATSHAVRWNEPFMVTVTRAAGAWIEDLDGQGHLDYWQGHFANVLGHNPALVRDALAGALAEGRGLQSGMLHPEEGELAELLCARTGQDVVRFTTTGSLATFYATLLARAFTGRHRTLKVAGGWHGSQPFGLKGVTARTGDFDHLESEGLPGTTDEDTLLTAFNDVAGLEDLFRRHGDEIACFIVEPWLGSAGGIPAHPEFLATARRLTAHHGALLIADEIITGFRFRAGDVCRCYDIRPDLLVLGKVIGGGMPVAAVLGRRDVLDLCRRAVGRVKFEGGTYSGHELSLVASLAMVRHLVDHEAEVYGELGRKGARLRARLAAVFAAAGVPACVTGDPEGGVPASSLVALHPGFPPERTDDLLGTPGRYPWWGEALMKSLFLLEGVNTRHGIGAVSLAHEDADLERTAAACERVLGRLAAAGLL